MGSVVVAANNAHHSLPSVAGTSTAARPSPMCFALEFSGVTMRFLVSLLLFFPLMSFACSNTAEQRELKSYALVLSKGELLEVAVYFPSEVEKAKASSKLCNGK